MTAEFHYTFYGIYRDWIKLIDEFDENEWVRLILIIKVMLASVDTTLNIQFNIIKL